MKAEIGKEEMPMRKIRVGKVVLSIAVGSAPEKLEKAVALAELLTGRKPAKTIATPKARTFRARPGSPIGVMVTMRKETAVGFLKKVLAAVDNKISASAFDNEGNFSFGLKEYLDIPGIKYNPEWGIIGMNINVRLERAGFRIQKRKRASAKIARSHRISKRDAIEFAKKNLGVTVLEE